VGKPAIFVGPHESGWQVKRANAQRASSVHKTKAEAIAEGIRLAKQAETELKVQRKDGVITRSESYGNDQSPPQDTEH
jgi:hypothetical protein